MALVVSVWAWTWTWKFRNFSSKWGKAEYFPLQIPLRSKARKLANKQTPRHIATRQKPIVVVLLVVVSPLTLRLETRGGSRHSGKRHTSQTVELVAFLGQPVAETWTPLMAPRAPPAASHELQSGRRCCCFCSLSALRRRRQRVLAVRRWGGRLPARLAETG